MYRKTRQLMFSRVGLLAGALLMAGPVWASGQTAGQDEPATSQSSNAPPADTPLGGVNPEDIVNPEARRQWEEAVARAHRFDDVPACGQDEIDAFLEKEKDHPDRYHDPDGTGYSLDKRNDLSTTSSIETDEQGNPRCKMGPFPELAPPPEYDFVHHPIHWKDVPEHIGELFELKKLHGLVQCPDYVDELGDQYFGDIGALTAPAGGFFGEGYSWHTYDLGGDEYCVRMSVPDPHDLSPEEAQILLSMELRGVQGPVTMRDFFSHAQVAATVEQKKRTHQAHGNRR